MPFYLSLRWLQLSSCHIQQLQHNSQIPCFSKKQKRDQHNHSTSYFPLLTCLHTLTTAKAMPILLRNTIKHSQTPTVFRTMFGSSFLKATSAVSMDDKSQTAMNNGSLRAVSPSMIHCPWFSAVTGSLIPLFHCKIHSTDLQKIQAEPMLAQFTDRYFQNNLIIFFKILFKTISLQAYIHIVFLIVYPHIKTNCG